MKQKTFFATATALTLVVGALAVAAARSQNTTSAGTPLPLPFGPIRELPSPAASPSGQPQLAVTPDGRVVLSWMDRLEGQRYAFRYAFRDGGGWTAPGTIVERDSFFANWADVPAVYPLGGGRLIAHWLQKSGPDTYAYDVRMSVSDAQARTWSADVTPHRDGTKTEHGFVSYFDWPGGGVGAVWLDGRDMKPGGHDGHGSGAMTLRAARIAPDGTIGPDERLDARVCECCPTTAVATANGALVAYRDRSEVEVRDIAVMRLENGKWLGPTYVHADNWKINACPVNGPALAAIGDRVALAWFTAEADTPRAMVAFSQDGGRTFGKPIRVDEARTLGRVDAVMLDDGSAVVLWMEFLEGGSELRARVVRPDGSRSAHVVVSSTTSDRQSGYARMVRAGKDLYFAWVTTKPQAQVKTAVAALR